MRKFNLILVIAFIGIISFQSCKKDTLIDDTTVTPAIEKTDVVEATSYTEWVYYSLSLGDTVSITSASTDKTWDLGFMRNHVRTNSGTSGGEQGGAYDANSSDLATITEASESGYADDVNTVTHYEMNFMVNPPSIDTVQISANAVIETWGQFNDQMSFELNNKTFVIKTADGKFAKIALLNYYNAETKGGYITFKYKYQEDGSTNIE